jgi:hypothetical protein
MPIPSGEVIVLREGVDGQGVYWQQYETIPLSELEGKEDYVPDWAAIKTALEVSSQGKGQNSQGI